MSEDFFVIVCLDNHEFLTESGETTQYILSAKHFERKEDAMEELNNCDDDIGFICYKVSAEFWLTREDIEMLQKGGIENESSNV